MRSVVALLLTVAVVAPTAAEEGADSPGSVFSWETPVTADAYALALDKADSYAVTAASRYTFDPRQARALAKRALRHYEEAVALDPKSAEAHYRAGQVLYYFFINSHGDGTIADDVALKAERHWHAFERLAPRDPRLPTVWFQMSLAFTRQATPEAFRKALTVYEKLIPTASPGTRERRDLGTYFGNQAELFMMLGDLDRAIESYEQAIDLVGIAETWYSYGLAVALDRDGQGRKAREIMRQAVMRDGSSRSRFMDSITSPHSSVFFVPAGERFYYLALGYESVGDTTDAISYYKRFIASGAHSRFQGVARTHIDRLGKRARTPR